MLTLYLLRHAKSDWSAEGTTDRQRPINQRGQAASRTMGRFVAEQNIAPDAVYCSPATRARQTWSLVRAELPDEPPWKTLEALYDFSGAAAYAGIVARLPADDDAVMLVGHNPSIGAFASALSQTGDRQSLERLWRKFPTAALAEIRFDSASWSDAMKTGGELVRFIRPKDLEAQS